MMTCTSECRPQQFFNTLKMKEMTFLIAFSLMKKANLRDLIAATGLVILLKLNTNCSFFSLCDFQIWQMTLINNQEFLPCSQKLCVSFHSHLWIQIPVVIWKWSNQKQIKFPAYVTLKFDRWPWKTKGPPFIAISSFWVFIAICEFKLKLQSGNIQFRSKLVIFVQCDLKI